ncbi:LANO_0B08438g1_1 [Lachancea nothofagi CBS 11611]|uniref:LANO_0B08438g1_1 n=1 Tax=Lachancea nothofagi CBS 11611 TaxID=1266666 RepID=A0A1G4J0V1_9SACH|nr:LANO_0B08438g1_1 [Lachancea nothofagi CBS 11611]
MISIIDQPSTRTNMSEPQKAREPVPKSSPVPDDFSESGNELKEGLPCQNEEEGAIYDFQAFVAQLRDPRADPILRYTRSFLNNFVTKRELWTCEEQRKLVDDFKVFVYGKLPLYEPFQSLNAGKFKNAQEGIEKLIMGKLYGYCFSPSLELRFQDKLDASHQEDLDQDERLRRKRAEFCFIDPGHLEIPESLSRRLLKFTQLSGKELARITEYKAPRDKMVCVLNACRVLFGFLKHSGLENGGADAFVPVLVYTLLKSDVESLLSNLNYIERFRYTEFLRGESAYYLSSVQGAANFIAHLKQESLHISDVSTFEERYTANQEILKQEESHAESSTSVTAVPSATPPRPAPSHYIRRPLDEATSALLVKVSELFSSNPTEPRDKEGGPEVSAETDLDPDSTRLVQQLQEQENQRVLEELHDMFPEMDQGLIHDVCEAKKYRIGMCVDVLLTLSS